MAARENQGLQIALIVFVMLTILLVVSTYMVLQPLSGAARKRLRKRPTPMLPPPWRTKKKPSRKRAIC